MFFKKTRILFIFIFLSPFIFTFLIISLTFYSIKNDYFYESDNSNNLAINKEKYLTYLPHSGFSNQRIELENAIFLAWFLNRTLIIPPILFFEGAATFWQSYDKLYNFLAQNILPNRNQLKFCSKNEKNNTKCVHGSGLGFRGVRNKSSIITYTMYNWDELLDFTSLKHHIKYINRQDFNYENLLKSLHIYDSSEAYNLTKDENRYQQRYYDNATSTIKLNNFKERVNLIDLKQRSEKLLHFASVFSSFRIVRQLPESKKFWNKFIKKILPNNPILINITEKIVAEIGGTNNFIGVHARLEGNSFLKNHNNTVQSFIKRIKEDFEGDVCLKTNIFLATDIKRDNIVLQPFFQTFSSCIYMLDNFNGFLEPLKFFKNPRDGVIMYELFVPLVDLLVVSKGNKFYGTKGSTFSSYAKQLHNTWIR
ncbi:2748_t:CDS:1 [Dentiscutata erythropus]|uniref:2748_t:CDS:1 n=1 Tax=Dentiscutata erythropus TaxID=1348616 RepID=A0A9N9GWW0_9GLOM|nr:2748_t:CDS:1 [Dentiscutata erythropus]